MKYGIWCKVSGNHAVTGYRYGWLKKARGTRIEFASRNDAEREAKRLNKEPRPVRRVVDAYEVRPIGEKE
jgi:hypothetical protein